MTAHDPFEPSTFALDVYYASGRAEDALLERHIAACSRCSAYLSKLESFATEPLEFSARDTPPPAARASLGKRKLGILSVATAIAGLGLGLWLSVAAPGDPEYVASKGVPAIQASIHSHGRSRIWEGRTALGAGDAIALRTGCDRFAHVAVLVATTDVPSPWSRVFDAACSSGDDPLPFSLVADDKPGVERIYVIFSQVRLEDARLQAALGRSERSSTAWVSQLTFHKLGTKP